MVLQRIIHQCGLFGFIGIGSKQGIDLGAKSGNLFCQLFLFLTDFITFGIVVVLIVFGLDVGAVSIIIGIQTLGHIEETPVVHLQTVGSRGREAIAGVQ